MDAETLPWDDLKVAFGIEDIGSLWETNRKAAPWPKGWTLLEISVAGARLVAIFRVETFPTIEDGNRVAATLVAIGANSPPAP